MSLRRFRTWQLTRSGPHFGLYLTGWFFLSNHSYRGERRYYVRVGNWRKTFGPVRR